MCLLRAQLQAEFELAHAQPRWPPWRVGDPTTPGHYLVRVENDERTWVRMERWDGAVWVTLGAYATPTGWLPLPPI
jgi:hypothetical protein